MSDTPNPDLKMANLLWHLSVIVNRPDTENYPTFPNPLSKARLIEEIQKTMADKHATSFVFTVARIP